MKKLVLVVVLIAISSSAIISCKSHKDSIFKTWTFSNIRAMDPAKDSMDNSEFVFLNKNLQNIKFQFKTNDSIKVSDGAGRLLSSGKFTMPDNNSIKFSFAADSVTFYKIEYLADTALNLIDQKQGVVMRLVSK